MHHWYRRENVPLLTANAQAQARDFRGLGRILQGKSFREKRFYNHMDFREKPDVLSKGENAYAGLLPRVPSL